MRLSFLLKIVVLCIALTAVVAVIAITTSGHFNPLQTKMPQTQTFFEQFVVAGGPVVWFVLLPMSILMVYLVAEFTITIRGKRLLPDGNVRQMTEKFTGGDDLVGTALAKATANGADNYNQMHDTATRSLQQQASQLMRRIDWLNLIGNVSPMVGLFGTVFGMIKLFDAIVTAGGQPQPAQLAEGISVALVTTFWGLLIAIPALAIHGIFANRIEAVVSDAAQQIERALTLFSQNKETQRRIEQRKQKLPIQQIPSKPKGHISESVTLR